MTILTGYINIKKENLKTDLNNETITKDDYDISLSELELKQKYEIGLSDVTIFACLSTPTPNDIFNMGFKNV